jgi:hypothetical protein
VKLRPRPHVRQHDSRLGVNQRVLRLKNRHAVHSEFASNFAKRSSRARVGSVTTHAAPPKAAHSAL